MFVCLFIDDSFRISTNKGFRITAIIVKQITSTCQCRTDPHGSEMHLNRLAQQVDDLVLRFGFLQRQQCTQIQHLL